MNKLRVGVFMGGKSEEREVSFNSGRTICDHLDTNRFNITPIFQTANGDLYILPWRFLHRGKISDFEHRLNKEAQKIDWENLKELVDFIYLAVHGRFAEDGTIQGMLEVLKIPYLGSKVFTSSLVMDKMLTREFLKMHNIKVPNGIVVYPHEINDFEKSKEEINKRLIKNNVKLPLIVKPHKEGSSIGISVVFNEKDLFNALKKACWSYPQKEQAVLIEEKIEGMEFTCIVLMDNKTGLPMALPITEVVPEENSHFFDYEQKYMPGRAIKFTPARCTKKQMELIQETSIKLMQALDIKTIARIDGILTKNNEVVIIDPNTLTGMSPSTFLFNQAAEIGMSHSELINHLIDTELIYYGHYKQSDFSKEKEQLMNKEKIRVAILLGGNSNEREISLESGRNIVYKLSPEKYITTPIFLNDEMELYPITQKELVKNSTKEISLSLDKYKKITWSALKNIADFVFIALHGGPGENGEIQGILEMLDIPYNGSSVFASSLCMDKYKTNQFLKYKGFDIPESELISKKDWLSNKNEIINKIKNKLHLPLILKPHDDGCSVFVKKINSDSELENSIEEIFSKGKNFALIEELIQGMELTVGVVGNENPMALPPSRALATKGILSIEEKFLPGAGENQTPAPLPKEATTFVQKTMEEVFKAVGCKGYARIDCFYQSAEISTTKKDRIVIIEVNTLPGMTPATCIFHQAAEIDIKPMDFVDLIITLGFNEHKKLNNSINILESLTNKEDKNCIKNI